MRGRRPAGPESVEHMEGSALAKERYQVLWETLSGKLRVFEACQCLNISEPRYHQLKTEMQAAGLASLEPGQAGRPAHQPSPQQQQIAALQQQVADLEVQLRAAQARAEIALVLPNVVQDEKQPEKKTPQRRTKRRRPSRNRPPGKRKNTCNASSNFATGNGRS